MFLRLAVVRRRPQIGFRYLPTSFQLHPSWNPEIYELHGCRRFEFLECWLRTASTRQPRYDDNQIKYGLLHDNSDAFWPVHSEYPEPSNLEPSWKPSWKKSATSCRTIVTTIISTVVY